jgi:predicted  nucleic acid-binding Zn-ribbon protein
MLDKGTEYPNAEGRTPMAKKEKKWGSLTKVEKIEWLRSEIDKIRTGVPRTAARTTKRLTDANSMLSDKIGKLSAKVDKLAKELQDIIKKLEDRGATSPEGPAAP